MEKQVNIRNSTIDFLVFTKENGRDTLEVRVQDENVWLTQEGIARLFDKGRTTIIEHLKNIFSEGELNEKSVCRDFRQTASDGKSYSYKFYNLEAIISVGYRVNSIRATQFRQWATKVLKLYTIQGYVLDKKRLENGQIFDEEYFDRLVEEIQEIRASERKFYQKITDIYATASDYDYEAKTTKEFFSTVQNKLHYAITHQTAAEIVYFRADSTKPNMGLTTWKSAPKGKIVKSDVSIAKNYLKQNEMTELNEIVEMYLDFANRQARKRIPMTMEDWAKKLDVFLKAGDEDILTTKGKISHELAKEKAETEFEKYRLIQDKKYKSDFDLFLEQASKITEN